MIMGLQVIALGCLIGAIVLGFVKKTNVGLVCFGLALILGKIGGMGASDIYKGFCLNYICVFDYLFISS
jgi:hypothetical protein